MHLVKEMVLGVLHDVVRVTSTHLGQDMDAAAYLLDLVMPISLSIYLLKTSGISHIMTVNLASILNLKCFDIRSSMLFY